MEKARNRFAKVMSRLGNSLFTFLSRCEERRYLSKLAGFLKVSLLGFFVLIVAACAKKPKEQPMVLCYVEPSSYLILKEISVTPNPTKGASTVVIRAQAEIKGDTAGAFVNKAQYAIGSDTFDMKASDGRFDNPKEKLESELSTNDYRPGNYDLYMKATANIGTWDDETVELRITE